MQTLGKALQVVAAVEVVRHALWVTVQRIAEAWAAAGL